MDFVANIPLTIFCSVQKLRKSFKMGFCSSRKVFELILFKFLIISIFAWFTPYLWLVTNKTVTENLTFFNGTVDIFALMIHSWTWFNKHTFIQIFTECTIVIRITESSLSARHHIACWLAPFNFFSLRVKLRIVTVLADARETSLPVLTIWVSDTN